MPTSHLFVVDKEGVSKKISKFSYWYCYYKKLMSVTGKQCSMGMDTDTSLGCATACSTDPLESDAKDINDKDNETVGCAYTHAADPLRSNAKDISDKDDESFAKTSQPVGVLSNRRGGGLVLVCNANKTKPNHQPHCQKHPIIYFDYLLS